MEMKNRSPSIDDLLFVWNHILQRFHALLKYNVNTIRSDEDQEEIEKHFVHLRCILLLILAKMLRILNLAIEENRRHQMEKELIKNDLKRLVFINDEKNQLLIHMACQDLGELLTEKQCRGRGKSEFLQISVRYNFVSLLTIENPLVSLNSKQMSE
jgi:hypothetical protein